MEVLTPQIWGVNYKDFNEPSKSYGSFGLPKFGQTDYKNFNEPSESYGSS